jgi:hypothetical protein
MFDEIINEASQLLCRERAVAIDENCGMLPALTPYPGILSNEYS